jgi:hypothetical protein
MFRRSVAEFSMVFLASLPLAACAPEEDECQPTSVVEIDPATGKQTTVYSFGCEGPADPDAKVRSGDACDGLDTQFTGVVELANGTSPLLATYFTEDNVIVVAKDRVELVDRQGKRLALARWDDDVYVDGALDTAAFDGSTLVVTAGKVLVSYDTNLQEVVRVELPSECTSSVLLSENRFVCGDPEENERSFHVYDALSGALLQTTTRYGFEEGPMSRVRGRDAFVSVNVHVSPRNFLMYAVDSTGTVTMTGNSRAANHGTFRISPVYAFPEDPATHLITDAGILVCLTREDCNDPTYSLLPEGDVRSLPQGRAFGAMDVDSAGKLHAIVGSVENLNYDEPSCEQGCVAERIDVATRAVETSMSFDVQGPSTLEALRADPQGGILLACGPGHRVLLLPHAP